MPIPNPFQDFAAKYYGATGGTVNIETNFKDAVSGVVLLSRSVTKTAVTPSGSAIATAWRRRYRRYCHWLIKQADNYTNGVGVMFSSGFSPSITSAEATELAAVKSALYGLGYRYGSVLGPAPITPP